MFTKSRIIEAMKRYTETLNNKPFLKPVEDRVAVVSVATKQSVAIRLVQ